MKKRIRKFFNYVLMLFTYPRELADAVNCVASSEELDLVIDHRVRR